MSLLLMGKRYGSPKSGRHDSYRNALHNFTRTPTSSNTPRTGKAQPRTDWKDLSWDNSVEQKKYRDSTPSDNNERSPLKISPSNQLSKSKSHASPLRKPGHSRFWDFPQESETEKLAKEDLTPSISSLDSDGSSDSSSLSITKKTLLSRSRESDSKDRKVSRFSKFHEESKAAHSCNESDVSNNNILRESTLQDIVSPVAGDEPASGFGGAYNYTIPEISRDNTNNNKSLILGFRGTGTEEVEMTPDFTRNIVETVRIEEEPEDQTAKMPETPSFEKKVTQPAWVNFVRNPNRNTTDMKKDIIRKTNNTHDFEDFAKSLMFNPLSEGIINIFLTSSLSSFLNRFCILIHNNTK